MVANNSNVRLFLLFFILLGSITWGLIGMFGINLIHNMVFGNPIAKKIIYSFIGIASLYFIMNPDTYLLQNQSECVFPTHILMHCEDATQGKKIVITTKFRNTSIIYWAKNDRTGELSNSGTAKTNSMGLATIVLALPDSNTDTVSTLGSLPKDIYYRGILNGGLLSRMEKTKF